MTQHWIICTVNISYILYTVYSTYLFTRVISDRIAPTEKKLFSFLPNTQAFIHPVLIIHITQALCHPCVIIDKYSFILGYHTQAFIHPCVIIDKNNSSWAIIHRHSFILWLSYTGIHSSWGYHTHMFIHPGVFKHRCSFILWLSYTDIHSSCGYHRHTFIHPGVFKHRSSFILLL